MVKQKLKQARLEKGISQEKMADLLGMDQSQYSRRENGKSAICNEEWDKLAKVLGVEKEEIFEDDNKNVVVNNGENSGDYSGNYNTYSGVDNKVVEKLMAYIELLEQKIKTLERD